MNIPQQDPNEKKPETKRSSGFNTFTILMALVFSVGMSLLFGFGLLSWLWNNIEAGNYAWVPWVLGLVALCWGAKKFFDYLDSGSGKKLAERLGSILAVLFVCGIIGSVVASCSGSSSSHCRPTRYTDC